MNTELHVPTLLHLIFGYAAGEHDILPDRIDAFTPASPTIVQVSAEIAPAVLAAFVERTIREPTSRSVNLGLCMLHARAAHALATGRRAEAEDAYVTLLRINPADANVRATLVNICAKDPETIISYVEPGLEAFDSSVEPHRLALESAARAAFVLNDYALVDRLLERQALNRQPSLRLIQARIRLLLELKSSCPGLVKSSFSPINAELTGAQQAFSERSMLDALAKALILCESHAPNRDGSLAEAAVACAVAYRMAWSRAYRLGQEVLAALVADADRLRDAALAWAGVGLPEAALGAALLRASAQAADPEREQLLCGAAQSLELLRRLQTASLDLSEVDTYWLERARAGAFAHFALLAPYAAGGGEAEPSAHEDILTAQAAVREPGPRVPIWYFITWHEHLDKLLRLIAVLQGRRQTVVVSIGGARLPDEFARLSALLLIERVHLLFRPAVTWGGPKLLYQNLFEVLEAFDRRGGEGAWLNVICNRSYPLLSPAEMSSLLSNPNFVIDFPSVPPPPAWRGELPDSVVDELPETFDRALTQVYATCDLDEFRIVANAPHKLDAVSFNFAPGPLSLEQNFKDNLHQYCISPYSADMRWMSLGRLTEFIDTSTENASTFSRRLPLRVMKWIHSVLVKHQLRTGDPFITIDKTYAATVLHDPRCIELFSAMNLGFGPEMNFLDTVAASDQYGCKSHLGHQYYRTEFYQAVESDIEPADLATNVEHRFFMRKTSPVISEPFISYFSEKIGEEWSKRETSIVLDVATEIDLPAAKLPLAEDLLGGDLSGLAGRLRNLKQEPLGDVFFEADGALRSDAGYSGWWRFHEGALELSFEAPGLGLKTYPKVVATADTIVLAPAEIVSIRNAWSVFVEFDLSAVISRLSTPTWIVEPQPVTDGRCSVGHSPEATLLRSFSRDDIEDYPLPVEVQQCRDIQFRRTDLMVLAFARLDGAPVVLRHEGYVVAGGTIKALFARATRQEAMGWAGAAPTELQVGLRAEELSGDYRLNLLDQEQFITLVGDRRILDASGAPKGWWSVGREGVRLFGLEGLRAGLAAQFQVENGRLRLSGWGWQDLRLSTAFSMTRL